MSAAAVASPPVIALASAVLCLTCETVHEGEACPHCGDRYGWPLSRWIGQQPWQPGDLETGAVRR